MAVAHIHTHTKQVIREIPSPTPPEKILYATTVITINFVGMANSLVLRLLAGPVTHCVHVHVHVQ